MMVLAACHDVNSQDRCSVEHPVARFKPWLAFSLRQEELTRLNKEAAVLATELGSVNQALHLEREANRNQANWSTAGRGWLRLGKRPRARTSRPTNCGGKSTRSKWNYLRRKV